MFDLRDILEDVRYTSGWEISIKGWYFCMLSCVWHIYIIVLQTHPLC